MQYQKYLRLTIFENKYDKSKSYGKLDYVYVNEKGEQDKDNTVHHKRIENSEFMLEDEESELDKAIDELKRQTRMTEYQLQRDGFLVKLDYHKAINYDRKNKILDAIAIKPKHNNTQMNNYHSRSSRQKALVSNLEVRNNNTRRVIRNGVLVLAIVTSVAMAGRSFTAFSELPEDELIKFHKVNDKVDKTSQKVINGSARAESIIGKLAKEKYHEVSLDDIAFLEKYYTDLGQANNDEDANFFHYSIYNFLEKGLNKYEKYIYSRLESLSNSMYVNDGIGNRYHYDNNNTRKYLIYAMSLVSGGEDRYAYENEMKSQEVASTAEGNVYYQMRPEYKLQILINLRETLRTRNIDFRDIPYRIYKIGSYDFNKDEFIRKLDDQILLVKTQLESMCNSKTRGRK